MLNQSYSMYLEQFDAEQLLQEQVDGSSGSSSDLLLFFIIDGKSLQ